LLGIMSMMRGENVRAEDNYTSHVGIIFKESQDKPDKDTQKKEIKKENAEKKDSEKMRQGRLPKTNEQLSKGNLSFVLSLIVISMLLLFLKKKGNNRLL
ncbi:hypothetical protein, partial [Melissococcus plutonius]